MGRGCTLSHGAPKISRDLWVNAVAPLQEWLFVDPCAIRMREVKDHWPRLTALTDAHFSSAK